MVRVKKKFCLCFFSKFQATEVEKKVAFYHTELAINGTSYKLHQLCNIIDYCFQILTNYLLIIAIMRHFLVLAYARCYLCFEVFLSFFIC